MDMRRISMAEDLTIPMADIYAEFPDLMSPDSPPAVPRIPTQDSEFAVLSTNVDPTAHPFTGNLAHRKSLLLHGGFGQPMVRVTQTVNKLIPSEEVVQIQLRQRPSRLKLVAVRKKPGLVIAAMDDRDRKLLRGVEVGDSVLKINNKAAKRVELAYDLLRSGKLPITLSVQRIVMVKREVQEIIEVPADQTDGRGNLRQARTLREAKLQQIQKQEADIMSGGRITLQKFNKHYKIPDWGIAARIFNEIDYRGSDDLNPGALEIYMHSEKNGKDLVSALDYIVKIGIDMPPATINLHKFFKLVPDYRPLVLERLFTIIDTDRDGSISLMDYERVLTRMRFGTLRDPAMSVHFGNARDMSPAFNARVNLDEIFSKDSTFTGTRTCILSFDGARQILTRLRNDDGGAEQGGEDWMMNEVVPFDDPGVDFLAGLTSHQIEHLISKCPPKIWDILMGIAVPADL